MKGISYKSTSCTSLCPNCATSRFFVGSLYTDTATANLQKPPAGLWPVFWSIKSRAVPVNRGAPDYHQNLPVRDHRNLWLEIVLTTICQPNCFDAEVTPEWICLKTRSFPGVRAGNLTPADDLNPPERLTDPSPESLQDVIPHTTKGISVSHDFHPAQTLRSLSETTILPC